MDKTVVIGVNVFIGGMGSLGICKAFSPAAIKQKKLSASTAAGDRSVSYGALESLDTEYSFESLPQAIFSEFAKLDNAEIIAKAANRTGEEVSSQEWTCIGGFDIEYDEFKEGEYLGVKISQKGLKKYTHEVDGKVKVNVDHDNVICEIDGKDILADVRNAILS